jgi:hypothetical protein
MRYFLVFLLVILSSFSYAGGFLSKNATITNIVTENGITTVRFTASDLKDPMGCEQLGVALLIDDTKNGDRQFSILLSAKMANKPIAIYTTQECFSGWNRKWPKIWSVGLQ